MITGKSLISLLFILYLCFNSEGKAKHSKYNETPYYFLDTNANIKGAIDLVSGLLQGEITSIEKKFKKDIPIWKINTITSSGGSLDVELTFKDRKLIRLDADEGPFDYEINPDSGLVIFSSAKKTAEDFAAQKTLKWTLFKNRDKWEYNFWLFTKTGKAQVRVDAVSGEIISVKKKK